MTKTQFAKALRNWRRDRDQATAAYVLDRSVKTYQNWEQARAMPQGRTLQIVLARIGRQSKRLHSPAAKK
jgi:DNA-binding transcriptional regulator YiaG